MRARLWRAADVLFLALFLFSVVVQVNDPDPLQWVGIYAAAAAACALSLAGLASIAVPGGIAVMALLWASTLTPRVVGRVPFLHMFGAWEMRDIGIEESREMYGLILVAGWMLTLAIRAWLARRRSPQGA